MIKIFMLSILKFVILNKNVDINQEIILDIVKNQEFSFELSNLKNKKDLLVLKLEGYINFTLNIKDKKINRIIKSSSNIFNNYNDKFIVLFDSKYYNENYVLYFQTINYQKNFKFKFMLVKKLMWYTLKTYKFIIYFLEKLEFKVKIKNIKEIDRTLINIRSSYFRYKLDLFIKNNLNNRYIKVNNYNYSLGLVKIINKNDKLFCYNCEYSILLKFKNIKKLFIKINSKKIKQNIWVSSKELSFYDNVLKEKEITYIFDMKKFVNDQCNSYVFLIKNIIGENEVYIHLNKQLNKLDDYQWKIKHKFNKHILIPIELIKKLGDLRKFYVTIITKNESFFNFDLYSCYNKYYINYGVEPEIVYSGLVLKNEIINYYLPNKIYHQSEISFLIDLIFNDNNNMFFIKDYKITVDDIQNKEESKKKYNFFDYFNKRKKFNFNCRGLFENNYPTIKECSFNIGVYGNSKNIYNNYNFVLKNYKYHKHIFFLNSNQFRLYKNESIYLKLETKYIVQSIKFYFYSSIGDIEIYFSDKNPYPDENDSIYKINFSRIKNNLEVKKKIVLKKIKDVILVNFYYLTIKAKSYSDLFLYSKSYLNNMKNNNEELISYKKIERKIDNKVGYKSFYFISKGYLDQHLLIEPLKGNFKICIQYHTKIYYKNTKCNIEIYTKLTKFKNYRTELSCITVIDLDFQLNKISSDKKLFKIMMHLMDFKPYNLELNNVETFFNSYSKTFNKLITIDISKAKYRVLLVLNTFSQYLTTCASLIKESDIFNCDFIWDYSNNNIILKHKYIKNNKYLYLKIYSEIKERIFKISCIIDHFPLQFKNRIYDYFYNQIYIISSKENNETINYKYKIINKNEHLFINISNFRYLINYYVYLYDDVLIEKFKVEGVKNYILKIPKRKFSFLKKPVLIINVKIMNKEYYLTKNKNNENFEYYNKNEFSVLQIYDGVNTILKESSGGIGYIKKGSFVYFMFDQRNLNNYMILLSSKANKTDLYLQQGKYKFPNSKYYFKKQTNYQTKFIPIHKSINNDFKFMTVGIFAKEESYFEINIQKKCYFKINTKQIYEYNLWKNKEIILTYVTNNDYLEVHLWSENSNILINQNGYNENNGTGFDDDDTFLEYKFPGSPKKFKIKKDKQSTIFFDIKNKERDTKINFLIMENNEKYVNITNNKKINYIFYKNEEQYFKILLKNEYNKLLRIENNFGEVEIIHDFNSDFKISNSNMILNNKHNNIIYINKSNNENKLNCYYLKIKANEYSKIQILVEDNYLISSKNIKFLVIIILIILVIIFLIYQYFVKYRRKNNIKWSNKKINVKNQIEMNNKN